MQVMGFMSGVSLYIMHGLNGALFDKFSIVFAIFEFWFLLSHSDADNDKNRVDVDVVG